jgi:hypothetical protein
MIINELEQIGSELGLKVMKNPVNPGHISLYSNIAEDFFMTTSEDDDDELRLRFYPYFRVSDINENMKFNTSSYYDEDDKVFRIVYPIEQGEIKGLTKEDLVEMHNNLIMQVRTLKMKLKTDDIEKDFV